MNATAIRNLRDVRMADTPEVGGKAASLGELIASGVRVPDGVVVTVAAAELPAQERGRLLDAGSAELGAGPFSVRSSGVAEDGVERSYAGMYESVLDVDVAGLADAVDRCLASARTARLAGYEPAAPTAGWP